MRDAALYGTGSPISYAHGDPEAANEPQEGSKWILKDFKCIADVTECRFSGCGTAASRWANITILEGDPATNKSSLCCALAACLTNGVAMPHAPSKGRPRKGGRFSSSAKTASSRRSARGFAAADADLDKVFIATMLPSPDDLDRIEKAIRKIGAKLVVVDTITDFVNGSAGNNQAVRRALRPLRELAERTQVAVVLLRHFTKKAAESRCSAAAAASR